MHQISSVDLPRHCTTFTSFIWDTFLVRSEYMTTSFDLFNRFYHPDKMLADSDVTGATTDTSMEGIRKLVLQGTTYDKRMKPYYGSILQGSQKSVRANLRLYTQLSFCSNQSNNAGNTAYLAFILRIRPLARLSTIMQVSRTHFCVFCGRRLPGDALQLDNDT